MSGWTTRSPQEAIDMHFQMASDKLGKAREVVIVVKITSKGK